LHNLSVIQEFPTDFKFGVATSSYQIEGNKNGDCGLSIWDDFARKKLNGIDGKEACRHLDFFKEDIKLIKDAGFKSYRFFFFMASPFSRKKSEIK
jgi:beta-glucosidase